MSNRVIRVRITTSIAKPKSNKVSLVWCEMVKLNRVINHLIHFVFTTRPYGHLRSQL